MTIEEIIESVLTNYEGLIQNTNWGERGIFYNPDNLLSKGIYLLTFKEKDGANDKASKVSRPGVYRLNLGISKQTFIKLFGIIPKRPKAGGVIDLDFDFAELDKIMPHPVYGWMAWVCVLNPSKDTYTQLTPLIEEGYQLALFKYKKKFPH